MLILRSLEIKVMKYVFIYYRLSGSLAYTYIDFVVQDVDE
jgi:hypothetical protein